MRGKTRQTGMSIVEILVGIVLLALVLIPSLTVILSETKAVTGTRDHQQAAFMAQGIMETARNYKFDLIEADQYSNPSKPDIQKTTYEWALKNKPEVRERLINKIKYEVHDVFIDPVKNTLSPNDPPILLLFRFGVEYKTGGQTHRLDISTALAKEE